MQISRYIDVHQRSICQDYWKKMKDMAIIIITDSNIERGIGYMATLTNKLWLMEQHHQIKVWKKFEYVDKIVNELT